MKTLEQILELEDGQIIIDLECLFDHAKPQQKKQTEYGEKIVQEFWVTSFDGNQKIKCTVWERVEDFAEMDWAGKKIKISSSKLDKGWSGAKIKLYNNEKYISLSKPAQILLIDAPTPSIPLAQEDDNKEPHRGASANKIKTNEEVDVIIALTIKTIRQASQGQMTTDKITDAEAAIINTKLIAFTNGKIEL